MTRRFGPRMAWFAVIVVSAVFAGAASRVEPGENVGPILADALRWCCWLGAAPVAWAAAAALDERDRVDGVAALASLHGAGASRLGVARIIAAMVEATLRTTLPVLVAVLAAASTIGASRTGILVAGVVAAGLVAGAVIGGLGALCGAWVRGRGRLTLSAVVLLPWMIADQWSLPGLSFVGLVDRAIGFFVGGVAS